MSNRDKKNLVSRARPVRDADNLAAIYVFLYNMGSLTSYRPIEVFMACYGDSFTFLKLCNFVTMAY
jgi:hypothetical protein